MFVILKLRLFENHTVVISLFVEKKLPLEYLFPSWKKVLDERLSAKMNDFRESYISCFMEKKPQVCRKGFLNVKD